MEKLIYPVFLQIDAAGYLVTILNINQSVQSGSLDEGIRIAEELLGLWLVFLLDNGESVPKAQVYYIGSLIKLFRNKYKDYFKEDEDDE